MGSEPEILSNRELDKEQPRMADFELLKTSLLQSLKKFMLSLTVTNMIECIDRCVIEDIHDDRVIFMLGDTRS